MCRRTVFTMAGEDSHIADICATYKRRIEFRMENPEVIAGRVAPQARWRMAAYFGQVVRRKCPETAIN